MSYESDVILDRLSLKRSLTLWRVVAILAVIGIGLALFARFNPMAHRAHVARIEITGIITDDPLRDDAIKDVAEDDNVKAVIVRVNSPGGTVVGGEALYRSLLDLGSQKPITVVMGEVAASAGYMTAIAGERIFARQSTITGSIGVLMQTADVTGLLDKIGIVPITIKSAPLKAQPNPLEKMSPEALRANQVIIKDMYEMFVDMVTQRRGFAADRAKALSDGRVFTGRQALEEGLIDEIGGEAEARAWLAKNHQIPEELPVFDVTWGPEEGLESVFGGALSHLLGGKAYFSERLKLDGLVSLWHPSLN